MTDRYESIESFLKTVVADGINEHLRRVGAPRSIHSHPSYVTLLDVAVGHDGVSLRWISDLVDSDTDMATMTNPKWERCSGFVSMQGSQFGFDRKPVEPPT
jgi:hypothetical protein